MAPPVPPPLSHTKSSSGVAGNKRPFNAEDSPDPTPEDLARMSRSERKRHREMKRRNHISKGFDELTALLVRIDPDFKAEIDQRSLEKQGRSSSVGADGDNSLPISRVELINHAVTIMERIHHENEHRRQLITELTARLRNVTASLSRGNDDVMVMVPTLTPMDSTMRAASRGGLSMVPPRYAALPPSLAEVSLAQQAAGFPSPAGQMLGMGVGGLVRGFPGLTPSEVLLAQQESVLAPHRALGFSGRGRQLPNHFRRTAGGAGEASTGRRTSQADSEEAAPSTAAAAVPRDSSSPSKSKGSKQARDSRM